MQVNTLVGLHSFLELFHSAHQRKPKKKNNGITTHSSSLCLHNNAAALSGSLRPQYAAQVVSSRCLPSGASQPVPTGTTTRSSSFSRSCAATHHAI
jgi:hypothetical protein